MLEVAGGPMEQPYRQLLAALLPGGGGGATMLSASPRSGFSIAQWRELSDLSCRAVQLEQQQRRQRGWRLLLTVHGAASYALLLVRLLHLLQAYRLLPQ